MPSTTRPPFIATISFPEPYRGARPSLTYARPSTGVHQPAPPPPPPLEPPPKPPNDEPPPPPPPKPPPQPPKPPPQPEYQPRRRPKRLRAVTMGKTMNRRTKSV